MARYCLTAVHLSGLHSSMCNRFEQGELGGSLVECRTLKREVAVRNLPPPCHVLKQDTLLPERAGNTQEAVALSQYNRKIVDWDVKLQHKQTNRFEQKWGR